LARAQEHPALGSVYRAEPGEVQELLARLTGFGCLELDTLLLFYDSGVMESTSAVEALGALAQDSRLRVFRLLVQAGPGGVPASAIAKRLRIPANTMSFHLKTLSHADLVQARQAGRFIYYSASYDRMNALLGFLTENCCGGCTPALAAPRRRRA
jgi:ArsR family transcriptional regulator, arsenate/arsenite/antimonite-responsive transcriptional repressor